MADIVTALYWWNPLLLHFLFPLLNQTQELFVDYSLTQNLSQQDRTEYLECISKSLKYLNHRQKKSYKCLRIGRWTLPFKDDSAFELYYSWQC